MNSNASNNMIPSRNPSQTSLKPDDYSDIINLPRPISKTHPRMKKNARAAQFAPYAALVGHHDLIAHEEQIASTKNNIDCEITTELDPEALETTDSLDIINSLNSETLDLIDNLETDPDFSQENPLDS